ncbi:hypothetical protein RJ640_019493 [Escallonia rubra]|uniref:Inositol-phosphate phosphatase n=1 Tax=Escallonia rubra TaxID=112253 RepID=A0AA88RXF0_9ASTE|nr:hypothetical protein RJ640_019493 [Escallonia rubra]
MTGVTLIYFSWPVCLMEEDQNIHALAAIFGQSDFIDLQQQIPLDAEVKEKKTKYLAGGAISSSDWVWGVRRLGAAAVDMCHVALGIVEAYWEYRLKPWDMAAGVLLFAQRKIMN